MARHTAFPHILIAMAAAPALGGEVIAASGVPLLGMSAETAGGVLIGIGIALMAGVIAQIAHGRHMAAISRTARPGCLPAGSSPGASTRPR